MGKLPNYHALNLDPVVVWITIEILFFIEKGKRYLIFSLFIRWQDVPKENTVCMLAKMDWLWSQNELY